MNPKPAFILTLPQPCTEDWNAMAPDGCGRFCASCQKTVVDFTVMTDAEIIDIFRNRETPPCGRFFPEQLNRPLQEAKTPGSFPFYKKIAAAVIALQAFTIYSFAQGKKKATTVYHKKNTQDRKQQVIKGRVLRYETSEPVTRLQLLVTAPNVDSFYTTTDTAGYFRFTLPDSVKQIHVSTGNNASQFAVNETIDLSAHPANIFIFSYTNHVRPETETAPKLIEVRRYEVMGIPPRSIESLILRKPTGWQRVTHAFRKKRH